MSTQLRLWIDFSIQVLILCLLALASYQNPEAFLWYLLCSALALRLWQLAHAYYEVYRYNAWLAARQLQESKLLFVYASLLLLFASVLALLTAGLLWPFVQFLWQSLQTLVIIFLPLLALRYFLRSVLRIYRYYTQARSFWDL